MPARLGPNRYGKSAVRLVKVTRGPDGHHLSDVTVDILLEGDFAAAHTDGDNRAVLPTDTMKNSVYALARRHSLQDIEDFGLELSAYFVETVPGLLEARVDLAERHWQRLQVGGAAHPHTFTRDGDARRTATVRRRPDQARVTAGIEGLWMLKSTGSGFAGFFRDDYTTLAETEDRLLATVVSTSWDYDRELLPFTETWRGIRNTILETFAGHDESRSVQHTAYVIGEAVLEGHPEVAEVRLSLPNKHHLLVDLAPFGLDNPDEVFVATDEPYGLIEVTVTRP